MFERLKMTQHCDHITPEALTAEAESAGFRVCGLFAPHTRQSDTLAVVLEKA